VSQPIPDKPALLVDVTRIRLDDLMQCEDSPLLASLKRLAAETDTDAIAGFSQGMT
jgi:hypothetical protein